MRIRNFGGKTNKARRLKNCIHFRYPTDDQLLICFLFQRHLSSVRAVSIYIIIHTYINVSNLTVLNGYTQNLTK